VIRTMQLDLTADRLAVCQLPADAPLPAWALEPKSFVSITRTPGELSIVCRADLVPAAVKQETGWRALRIAGPLDFGLTGVLASVLTPLAQAGVSIFAVSTYDTDYVLVRESKLSAAIQALRAAGHDVKVD
jgi:hypothetical protein